MRLNPRRRSALRQRASASRRTGGTAAFVALLVVLVLSGGLASTAFGAVTYTVNSTADPGSGTCDAAECTLREAIDAANASAGADSIHFSIPGPGPHTITLASALPTITGAVVIDGTTEPDYAAGSPVVEINGQNVGVAGSIFAITGGSSIVRGLVLNRMPVAANGVYLAGPGNNIVERNRIGTNVDGTVGLSPNGIGVRVETSTGAGNRISDNLISGNNYGIFQRSPSNGGSVITGNVIGLDVTGTVMLSNPSSSNAGIEFERDGGGNTIGGTVASERNVIAAHWVGIRISGSSNNVVEGNYVGTDVTGLLDRGNEAAGIAVLNFQVASTVYPATGNRIGGTGVGSRNVISGNGAPNQIGTGITIGADSNTVQGNYVGLGSDGTTALGNGRGIEIQQSNNVIGGAVSGAGNVISANYELGVMFAFWASGNTVERNLIGLDASGTQPRGNGAGGVSANANLVTASSLNRVADNEIAHNAGNGGVFVFGGTGTTLTGNSIHDNESLGIDLYPPFAVTANDTDDPDTGANDLQNFPLLTGATTGSGSTITGSLNSTPSTTFRLEFFANSACDASGNGEGELYLGSDNVMTDGGGDVSFSSSVPTNTPSGWVVTATATNPDGSTSEFSECVESENAAATLIVIKHVINDNGGTAEADDFTLDSGGTDDTPDDFPGEEAPGTSVSMSPGSYNVTETGPSGYTASYSADCAGTIAAGETKTCTVTNDDIQQVDSQITPGTATCAQFNGGTSATLSQLNYTVRNGKIYQVDPSAFFYWVKVTAVAGSNTFTINQAITTGNFDSHFFNHNAGHVYTSGCVKRTATISTSAGVTTVNFSAASAGTYVIGVKYNAWSVKSFPAPSPTTVHYTFQLDALATSLKGLDLVKVP